MPGQTKASVWYAFLDHLSELKSPNAVCRIDGMPALPTFRRRMTRDPVFAGRVNALWVRRKVSEDKWEALLELLERHTSHEACRLVGMGHSCFMTKRRKDASYDARVRSLLSRADLRSIHCRSHAVLDPKVQGAIWDEVIGLLATVPYAEVWKRPETPSEASFYKKLKNEALFADRVEAACGRRFRRKTSRRIGDEAAVWETFLVELETTPLFDLVRRPGMPSVFLFHKKRRADADFDERVVAILSPRICPPRSPQQWQAFVAALTTGAAIKALCRQPSMPSRSAVRKRARSDPRFRAILAESVRRRREQRIEAALASAGKKPRRRRTTKSARPAVRATLRSTISREELYAAVAAVVPKGLPPVTRDDIIGDMVLAVLEGELDALEMKARAKDYIREHWRMFGTLKNVSLDATLYDDSGSTRGDRLEGHGADYW